MKIKIDRFVLSIIAVIILAYLFPQLGSKSSKIPLDTIGSVGVSFIFFFYGIKLSPENIKSGLKNWRLHVLIQASTFLLFPLIVLCFYPFIQEEHEKNIWLGFLFLAAIPSTVSSSVVMVSIARGNIPAAIFNASISGLLGMVITPLWMGLFLTKTNADYQLGEVYLKLFSEVLAPVILGLFLHRYLGKKALEFRNVLALFDKSIILLIIYKSFATSFEEKVFSAINTIDFVTIAIAVFSLFYLVYLLIGYLSDKLGFAVEDKITARFCGTKKSLVHGTVFSKILFHHSPIMGIVLLPLMLFHAFQIFITSFIANRLAKRTVPMTGLREKTS